jgi:hypothetical protein
MKSVKKLAAPILASGITFGTLLLASTPAQAAWNLLPDTLAS